MTQTIPRYIDWDEIIPGLAVGSAPPYGNEVAETGFDVLVLCAEEFQPPSRAFPGVELHYIPLPDYTITPDTVRKSFIAAGKIRDLLLMGKKVLVTCLAGMDRSASIAALVLYYLYFQHGWDGNDCVRQVRSRRHGSLRGAQAKWLKTLPPKV